LRGLIRRGKSLERDWCPTCGSGLRGSFPVCIDCQVVEAMKSGDAVDPQVTDSGKPSTRVENS
jgi:hypothetical protein